MKSLAAWWLISHVCSLWTSSNTCLHLFNKWHNPYLFCFIFKSHTKHANSCREWLNQKLKRPPRSVVQNTGCESSGCCLFCSLFVWPNDQRLTEFDLSACSGGGGVSQERVCLHLLNGLICLLYHSLRFQSWVFSLKRIPCLSVLWWASLWHIWRFCF